jgi:hypothetical protein
MSGMGYERRNGSKTVTRLPRQDSNLRPVDGKDVRTRAPRLARRAVIGRYAAPTHAFGSTAFTETLFTWHPVDAMLVSPAAPSRPPVHGERGESTGSTTRAPTVS